MLPYLDQGLNISKRSQCIRRKESKMKKITILGIDKDISEFFKNEINNIFNYLFEVDYRNTEMVPVPNIYDTDLILYTDPEILIRMVNYIKCDAPTLMMKRTITRKALEEIKRIPKGSRALVANINQYMANETMALIYQLGINNLKLSPFYEGIDNFPEVDYIISPQNYSFLPDIGAKLVRTGNRVFDISNILDIISLLRVEQKKSEEIIKKYMAKVPTFWYGIGYTWGNRRVLLTQWQMLLDDLSNGVIITNNKEEIILSNKKAGQILGIVSEDLAGKSLYSLVEKDRDLELLVSKDQLKEEVLNYKGKDLVITLKSVVFDNIQYGKVIMISPYTEIVDVQQRARKKIIGKGYYSRHHFSDMVGEDPGFKEAKDIGRRVASSESTVLLTGESGTGKELFAGAIHNFSLRKENSFVAVNCATLPENLLESELFGYEEGAFTGARKGGKIGLFERAEKGTLFLDEIGDLPLKLQSRLLRALEEKEIMRIGGDSIISVDVRVIAATNKDLLKLIEEGKFRKDLFYRLNIFQISLPPLRKRRKDIPVLIEYFLNNLKDERLICKDFKVFYSNYHWPGNVRELKNVLKYMTTISDSSLSYDNLPGYLKKKEYYVDKEHNGQYLLLKSFYYRDSMGLSTGRRSLTRLFNKLYYNISEMEVRKLIRILIDKGAIKVNEGRKGNQITDYGVKLLKDKGYVNDESDIFRKIKDI